MPFLFYGGFQPKDSNKFSGSAVIMEFNEKLQQLRKKKGLTQEELANSLFVSRTAVSKWESGRGYPSIESLKIIAKFFGVTIDELLSGDELLDVAKEEGRQKENQLRNLVFGLLDLSAVVFLFLPFFGQKESGAVREVSLLNLTEISGFIRIVYLAVVALIVISGVLTLVFRKRVEGLFEKGKFKVGSLVVNIAGALVFVLSRQPYAATFLIVFLAIKVLMLLKKR